MPIGPRSSLPVYRRQPFPDRLVGERVEYGKTVFETDAVRMWNTGDDIGVVSFKSKMHAIGEDVLDGVMQAIDEAERDFKGLIIWQTEPPFSVGANLRGRPRSRKSDQKPSAFAKMMKGFRREAESMVLKAARKLNVADALMAGRLEKVEGVVEQFQATTQAWKYALVPTVAAVDGMALGGGCEFDHALRARGGHAGKLHRPGRGRRRPAAGGRRLQGAGAARGAGGQGRRRSSRSCANTSRTSRWPRCRSSAEQAREMGYLKAGDRIVMNRLELLHVAKSEVTALAEAGYRPPLRARQIPVAGRSAIATFKAHLANMLAGQYISEHDFLVASKIAYVLCGGDVEAGSLVDEQWFLDLERECFMELLATEKTQARIEHTLKTGKPLEKLRSRTEPSRVAPAVSPTFPERVPDMAKQVQDAYIVAATAHAGGQGAARHVPQRRGPTTCSRTC